MSLDQEERVTSADIRKAVNRLGGEVAPAIDLEYKLDELYPKPIWQRFGERDKLLKHLAENQLWGINQQVFVTTLSEAGKNQAIVASQGLTKCTASPAIDFTPNLICFNGSLELATEFVSLPQAERIKSFEQQINDAESFVIFAHGWDGRDDLGIPLSADLLDLSNPDEYDDLAKIMAGNPRLFDLNGSLLEVPDDETIKALAKELDPLKGKVAIIALGVMGSQKSLNEKHKDKLTEDGIKTQLFETIDRIGIAVTESKMKQITNDEWQSDKRQLIDTLYKELAFGINDNQSLVAVNEILNKLCNIFQTEYSVANGTWWYENIGVVMGHSMGGNINMKAFIDVVFGKEVAAEYTEYRKKMTAEGDKAKSRVSEVDQLNEKLSKWEIATSELAGIPGVEFSKSFDRLVKTFGGYRKEDLIGYFVKEAKASTDTQDLWIESDNAKDRVPNATFMALQPVVGGDDIQSPPSWFVELKSRLGKKESYHVRLEKDRLLSTINKIPSQDVRSIFMRLGKNFSILFPKVAHFTGKNMSHKKWIDELYVYGNVADGAYHEHGRILRQMYPFAPDDIFPYIGSREMVRGKVYFGNPLHETTLSAAYGRELEILMRRGESGNDGPAAEAVRTYIRHLPSSGHHYSKEDMPVVKADMYAGILSQQREKQKKLSNLRSRVKAHIYAYN